MTMPKSLARPKRIYSEEERARKNARRREKRAALRAFVPGVGPDAPVVKTERGGLHSDTPYRVDVVPPKALLAVAGVLKPGTEKYGLDNWRRIARREHLNHALVHIFAHLAGDQSDDHLTHAACRLLFALETE